MSDFIPSANISRTPRGTGPTRSEIDETGLGAVDAVPDEGAPSSMWGEAWKRLRCRPIFWFAATIIFFAVMISVFPWLFTSQDPRYCVLSNSLGAPELWSHPFGFDKQGCDIYSRVIYGARASVSVGVLTTIAVVIIGGTIGATPATSAAGSTPSSRVSPTSSSRSRCSSQPSSSCRCSRTRAPSPWSSSSCPPSPGPPSRVSREDPS